MEDIENKEANLEIEEIEKIEPEIEPEKEPEIEKIEKIEEKEKVETEKKRRGRPAGAKNKPKIIETPIVTETKTETETATETATEPKQKPIQLFTQEQVQQLLLNSCRLQEQKQREEKRERYAALFRKQKWTQG
jgi:hypothetical protein